MMIPHSGRDQTVLRFSRRGGREGDFANIGSYRSIPCVAPKQMKPKPSKSPAESGRAALVEGQNHLTREVELALRTFTNQIKPTFLTIVIAVIYLSTNVAGYSQGTHSKFEAALKKELLSNHQRHVPVVTVKGSEVRLTYGPKVPLTTM